MKDAQKPDHVSLNSLITRLKEGRFVIPDFQREFEWQPSDIRDLIRSICLDYYIGSLLLWKGKKENFSALSCEPIYGQQPGGSPEHIVLDGQQRLTALFYAATAPDKELPSRKSRYVFFIRVDRFMAEEYDKAFDYDWTQWGAQLLSKSSLQFENHIFPFAIIGRGGFALYDWVNEYRDYWREKARIATDAGDTSAAATAARIADEAKAFGETLREITEQYQVSFIELDRDLNLDKVCDIFTKINTKGVRLDVFDLINALLTPKGLKLKHMWREVSPRFESLDAEKMNVYVLQVISILRQAYCSPKYLYFLLPGQEKTVRDESGALRREVLVRTTDEFKKYWKEAVDALDRAVQLLQHPQEFGAISASYLPYVSILPAFAALQATLSTLPADGRLNGQRKVRHWYWASVFTNRYSGSVESTTARDYLDVKAWLNDDSAEPPVLLEFQSRFRNLDLRKEVKRGSSVYNGVFNLLVLQGARDWMTGNVPQPTELDDHHIVPASWGAKKLKGDLGNSILNRTPLTADTNRNIIGDKLPNEYLPQLIKTSGETAVRKILESHFISPEAQSILLRTPFTVADFEEFIAERQSTIQAAIEDLLIKERLDLAPHLRDLDEKTEQVELGLRDLVARALGENPAALPPHILQKIDERLQAAARKNPAMDQLHYQTVAGKLEYCDLRELQDTITNKALWPQFEARFGTKESLAVRFGQLAEVRNGIRHSRSVDAVTRKDGEAALLWFAQVLAK